MLGEVPHELSTAAHSKECKRSPQQFIPAGFPPNDNLQPGTEDSDSPPSPHRTWSVPDASSQPQLNLQFVLYSRICKKILYRQTEASVV